MKTAQCDKLECYLNDPNYPSPSPEILKDYLFNAIWNAIKGWDISRYNDGTYSGATGSDAMHIYNSIIPKKPNEKRSP